MMTKDLSSLTPKAKLFLLAVIIGLLTGAAAAALKWIIARITLLLHPLELTSGPDWTMLAIPVVGILLTAMYQSYVIKTQISHGVDRLVNDLSLRRYDLSPRLTYAPIIASSLTLGFGGSAGSEGPIAYTGAAIGSNIGRIFKVSPEHLYILIACGAGAGIAGIFKASIGGALFTLEVLGMTLTTVSVIALLSSTITASLTAYVLSGFTIDLAWSHNIGFRSELVIPVVVLGVFCGIYSVYYSFVMKKLKHVFEAMRNPWMMNIFSGLILAVSLFLFPSLYGEGYGVVDKVINGNIDQPFFSSLLAGLSNSEWWLVIVLGGILIVKCFACCSSNSGGGVAGDFAPTLFAGCIAGLLFALLVNNLFGLALDRSVFAFIGMAGVMAGVIRAPLMAIFLTAEMCNGYDYLLPLVIVSLISYAMVMAVTGKKFYHPRFLKNRI